MDSNLQENLTGETKSAEEQDALAIVPSSSSSLPIASISLSFSTFFPSYTQFFLHPRFSQLFPHHPNKVKIPTQASSLTHLSLSTAPPPPPSRISFNSTVAANPLQSPLSLGPRRPVDPSSAAALRRASVVWFRNDLRVHDNECLSSANDECVSVLPVYCFDPRDYVKSSSGFDKTGPFRAQFLIESVSDLRKNLQARGSDLVVRVGKPESVLVELAKEVGADAIYAHREVSHDEVKAEERIEAAMKEEGVEVKYFWGSTLYHMDDLPFKLGEMPANYGAFRDKVKGLEIRKTMAALDQLKGLPSRGDVEPGDIPSLVDLGINPSARTSQEGKPARVGGETEALNRIQSFAAECQARSNKAKQKDNSNSVYGSNFSCKISPWLAMGCISPRSMFDELKKTVASTTSAVTSKKGSSGDIGLNWLMYELLWRDFFRFITKKYSSAKRQVEAAVHATACAGALA
ncbi:PREDICTED: blue-light photoreceptor PHR2 [Tarenaya hassleriana]|uniref:blue-light photoreceptor PHR2 n=1 Tax=Tarenaya hassleriana TaxID=28532 RepID=UPI00053C602D|nr:PREDICTED: blue-light photoreceptor PHR2 [Tarenaya hassleriana]